ncbi:MAG: DNA-processing protein DprA [Desulfobacteraceae bacterium]|nr:DNA-processing protein DprA [Desulfobacteraceae bacterium]
MKYTENAINILTAKNYKGIGRAWIIKHFKGNEKVDAIVSLINKYSKEEYPVTIEEFEKNKAILIQKLKKLDGFADGFTAIGDNCFPIHRGRVKNSEQPIYLFYRGDINLLAEDNKNIAVIGLLEPDKNIENSEREVVSEFVKNGAAILSGLAFGCDTIAHKQTLALNGKTIAVLPGTLNNILPSANKDLADEIVKKSGLLVTEYYEEAKSQLELRGRYQERDRLQALFSDAVVLSASYAKNNLGNDSGSRLAMGYALNYSIPRAVIYDLESDCDNPKYDLNRQLINDDKELFVITKKNLVASVKKLMSLKKSKEPVQMSLFDLI